MKQLPRCWPAYDRDLPVPDALRLADISAWSTTPGRSNRGFLFFAFPGAKADGRQFAPPRLPGAVAVVSESPAPSGTGRSLAASGAWPQGSPLAARNFYHAPDARLGLTGSPEPMEKPPRHF